MGKHSHFDLPGKSACADEWRNRRSVKRRRWLTLRQPRRHRPRKLLLRSPLSLLKVKSQLMRCALLAPLCGSLLRWSTRLNAIGRCVQEAAAGEEVAAEEEAAPEPEVRTVAQVMEGMGSLQEMLDTGELTQQELTECQTKLTALEEELTTLLPEETQRQTDKLQEKKTALEAEEDAAKKAALQEEVTALEGELETLAAITKDRNMAPAANVVGAKPKSTRDLGYFADNGVLTDITVKAGEGDDMTFNLHRIILASKSNFFFQRLADAEHAAKEIKGAFTPMVAPAVSDACYKNSAGKPEEEKPAEEAAAEEAKPAPEVVAAGGTINVEDPGEIFDQVIKAMYQGGDVVLVNEENVFKLLQGAIAWDVPELLNRVHQYLSETMTTGNATGRLLQVRVGFEVRVNFGVEVEYSPRCVHV